jgi:hypothetical protein
MSMVEKVVRALRDEGFDEDNPLNPRAKDLARAAIAAMLEPTDEMERAWARVDPIRFDWGSFHEAHEAGIDAALKEPEARPVAQEQQSDLPTPR